ncbi:MAG: GDP-mannose 4,6-dehydratase [Dehalococcoidia bacterium]|nr:GDP-mannose 4,6-dehydratase [Dehalococcoidia bacterium]
MKALITGGAGFIGSHLSEELLGRGNEVAVFDDLSTGNLSNIDHLRRITGFTFHQGSVLDDMQELSSLIEHSDHIYHLAAVVGVAYVLEHPVAALETNTRGTENVLRLASQFSDARSKKRVILASSSEVYGKSAKVPFREDDDSVIGPTLVSRWGYACAKALEEFVGLAYHREKGLPVVILRLFNTVGPRQTRRYGMVMPRLVSQAIAGEPVTVYGDGEQTRSFTYVKDVVKAIADISLVPSADGQLFNVGNNREVSINELAELVRNVLDSPSATVHIPFSEVYGAEFEETRRRVADISKIREYISYAPTTNLAFVVKEIADDLRTRQGEQGVGGANERSG